MLVRLLVFVGLTRLWSGPVAPPPPPPARPVAAPLLETKGAFFALSVADLKASAAWYAEKLGLVIVTEIPGSNGPAVTVLEGGGLIVELIHDARAKPSGIDPMLGFGIVKAGVMVDDFDGTVAALRARRVEIAFGPFPMRATERANVIVKDNAGNLIQIFGPRA